MKKCTKCGEVKDVDGFTKNKTKKYGLEGECKKCKRYRDRKWNAENCEKRRKASRKWNAENPKKVRERVRAWKNENPESVRQWGKKECAELRDTYIKHNLRLSGFTPTQIAENPELIELKRVIIKTKRFIKTKEDEKH